MNQEISILNLYLERQRTSQNNVFKCKFCPHTSKKLKEITEHTNSHYNNKVYKCFACGYQTCWSSCFCKHKCPSNQI